MQCDSNRTVPICRIRSVMREGRVEHIPSDSASLRSSHQPNLWQGKITYGRPYRSDQTQVIRLHRLHGQLLANEPIREERPTLPHRSMAREIADPTIDASRANVARISAKVSGCATSTTRSAESRSSRPMPRSCCHRTGTTPVSGCDSDAPPWIVRRAASASRSGRKEAIVSANAAARCVAA